jgi:transcriptional regulator with XRE-family HTH domain
MSSRKTRSQPENDSKDFGAGTGNSVDVRVGDRIRMRRVMLRYSVHRLSELLGVSLGQLMKWESGEDRVGAERLLEISGILQESPLAFLQEAASELTGWTGSPTSSDVGEPSIAATASESLELYSAFSRITDAEARRKVVAYASALASNQGSMN